MKKKNARKFKKSERMDLFIPGGPMQEVVHKVTQCGTVGRSTKVAHCGTQGREVAHCEAEGRRPPASEEVLRTSSEAGGRRPR